MSAAKKAGVIYILTNPSFPDYVKIGYATNIENRLKQLNRSECIPFAFRVYATYDVSTPLQDKELHSLIDRLNPDLRAIDTFDGKTRTKEFYAMTKEDAYALLESIAKLSGTMDKLQRLTPEGHEIADEEVAAEIQEEAKETAEETPSRRGRKSRTQSEPVEESSDEPVQDGTTNTDSETVVLDADTYFHDIKNDNYVMKHAGDSVDMIVDGVEVMKVITKEEFGEGIKKLSGAGEEKTARKRRTRKER